MFNQYRIILFKTKLWKSIKHKFVNISMDGITLNKMIKVGSFGNIYKDFKYLKNKNIEEIKNTLKIDYIYLYFKEENIKLLVKNDDIEFMDKPDDNNVIWRKIERKIKYKKDSFIEISIFIVINLVTGHYCILDDSYYLSYIHFINKKSEDINYEDIKNNKLPDYLYEEESREITLFFT